MVIRLLLRHPLPEGTVTGQALATTLVLDVRTAVSPLFENVPAILIFLHAPNLSQLYENSDGGRHFFEARPFERRVGIVFAG